MDQILAAAKGRADVVRLLKLCQSRKMKGVRGTWEEFIRSYDTTYGQASLSPSWRSLADMMAFLRTLFHIKDLELLALSMRPTRCLVYDFSWGSDYKHNSLEQSLVRTTLYRDNHNLQYLSPCKPSDLVVTGSKWETGDAARASEYPLTKDMTAVRCAIVCCEDGTEAVARVAAVDHNFNVRLDTFVELNKPVADYRTAITGITRQDVENAGEYASLKTVQARLLELFPFQCIMVGHCLYKDLKALKLDHARIIDTSALFKLPMAMAELFKYKLEYEVPIVPERCVLEALALIGLVRCIIKEQQRRKRKRAFVVGGIKRKLKRKPKAKKTGEILCGGKRKRAFVVGGIKRKPKAKKTEEILSGGKRKRAFVVGGFKRKLKRKKVTQMYMIASLDRHFSLLYVLLKEHIADNVDYKVIIFCTTAMVTRLVADLLSQLSLNVREIHSRKPQSYRTRVSDEFRKSKSIILVTSDVSARGVDYPDVSLVVQMGLPSDREQYIHRLGRTGRKGKEGEGVLLLAPWEEYFMSSVKDLPITKSPLPPIDPEAVKRVQKGLSQVEMKNKEAAYQAWLGYYKSQKMIARDTTRLVELANEFSRSMGLDVPPAIPKNVLGKMGLKNVPGLRTK